MKKIKSSVLLVFVLVLFLSVAVGAYSINVLRKKDLSRLEKPLVSFAKIVDDLKSNGGNEKKKADIPVYSETDLLFDTNGSFDLGRDAGFYYGLNSRPNDASSILAAYPTSAIRLNDNGSVYTVHDTDSGYRLFLFFDKNNDYTTPIGFPVVIKSVLSFSDFAGLDVGDPIEAVEKIDPVATLHKKLITDVWKSDVKGTRARAERGYPCTSIHYLKDGLLRIEYDMLDDGSLVISRIELNEDHIMTDVLGNEIDYTIDETDLPK